MKNAKSWGGVLNEEREVFTVGYYSTVRMKQKSEEHGTVPLR
jgi:hypothetical protein